MKTFIFLVLVTATAAIDLSFLHHHHHHVPSPSPWGPIGKACEDAAKTLNASKSVRAAALNVSKDLAPIANKIGTACAKTFAPCKGPDGATQCCVEDAFKDGLYSNSSMADLMAYNAAVKAVVKDAYICMLDMSFVMTTNATNTTNATTFQMTFENYTPLVWGKECNPKDGHAVGAMKGRRQQDLPAAIKGRRAQDLSTEAHEDSIRGMLSKRTAIKGRRARRTWSFGPGPDDTYLKWAGTQCMNANKAHGFKECTISYSKKNCPPSGPTDVSVGAMKGRRAQDDLPTAIKG